MFMSHKRFLGLTDPCFNSANLLSPDFLHLSFLLSFMLFSVLSFSSLFFSLVLLPFLSLLFLLFLPFPPLSCFISLFYHLTFFFAFFVTCSILLNIYC